MHCGRPMRSDGGLTRLVGAIVSRQMKINNNLHLGIAQALSLLKRNCICGGHSSDKSTADWQWPQLDGRIVLGEFSLLIFHSSGRRLLVLVLLNVFALGVSTLWAMPHQCYWSGLQPLSASTMDKNFSRCNSSWKMNCKKCTRVVVGGARVVLHCGMREGQTHQGPKAAHTHRQLTCTNTLSMGLQHPMIGAPTDSAPTM